MSEGDVTDFSPLQKFSISTLFWHQGPISEALLCIPYDIPKVVVTGNISPVEVDRDRKSGASKLLHVV